MLFEIVVGTLLATPFLASDVLNSIEYKRFSRSKTYSVFVGWWIGAFRPENAYQSIANMIDSDYNCDIWKDESYRRKSPFISSHLNTRIELPYEGPAQLFIANRDKSSEDIFIKASLYDDYIISRAINRWKKRSEEIKKRRELLETETLINERITQGYINTIENIEKKILGKEEATVAKELRASLPSPEMPKENKINATQTSNAITFYDYDSAGTVGVRTKSSKSKIGTRADSKG